MTCSWNCQSFCPILQPFALTRPECLFSNDLHQYAFPSPSIKLPVEDLFPGTEVQLPFGDGDDYFTSHYLTFEMCVRIVLAGPIMVVLIDRFVGRQFLKPNFVVVMQAALVVVDEYGRGDVHRVAEAEPLLDAAFADQFFDGAGDVDEAPAARNFKPKVLCE